MTNYTILRRKHPADNIAVPFNRASSKNEVQEMIGCKAGDLDWRNLDTHHPLLTVGIAQYFVFTEE